MTIYDVFTGESALGNPCGVVVLDEWLSDNALLQWARKIAQPVTSFVIESNGEFHIRWFSLEREISLCGHGSLGAGAAILIKYALNEITFKSQYGGYGEHT
ncbi:PhzF family phenazine biosynthesis protein [uncultured Shewanella sp.]|uniref:PhzF family phenazine biosynthesis protein n=1 Tax=uncultured Shewanella sp. TaxID=173975 RepID=UPI002625E91D|nr:PhzF family phenazine biosynthesis protein [uncultured Shewanella sp.]